MRAFTGALELIGIGLIAAAAFLVAFPLGLAVTGIAAIAVAAGLDRPGGGK